MEEELVELEKAIRKAIKETTAKYPYKIDLPDITKVLLQISVETLDDYLDALKRMKK